jgi:hypothetical protein
VSTPSVRETPVALATPEEAMMSMEGRGESQAKGDPTLDLTCCRFRRRSDVAESYAEFPSGRTLRARLPRDAIDRAGERSLVGRL